MSIPAPGIPSYRPLLGVALILAAVAAQQFVQLPWRNAFTSSLSNWLHVPMFVVITAMVLWLRPRQPLWMTLLTVAVIAVVSEALQLLTERQASLADLAKDGLGAAIAVVLLRAPLPRPKARRIITAAVLTAATTMLVPSVYLLAYAQQQRSFPVLYAPDSVLLRAMTDLPYTPDDHHAIVRKHPWPAYASQPVLSVTWAPARWPGVHFLEPVGRWQGYTTLRADVYNLEAAAQPLTAGVRHRGAQGTARYHRSVLQPGHNSLRIPLSQLALLDDGTPATITHLMLYSTGQHAGKQILLGRVWLE